jgi:hypothetical protein
VQENVVVNLISFLEGLDAYRFGRAAPDAASKNVMLEKTEGLIRDLARQKKGKPS